MITQTFDLNMIPDSAPVVIHCDQYDHVEDRLIAKLFKGDVAYTPAAGATAIVQGRKPDGKGFTYSVSSISGNTVTFDLTEQMSAVAGRVKCQLVITENFDRTGTFAFDLDVQRSALPANTDMSTSEYEYVEELIETAESINIHPPIIGQNGNWYVWDTNTKAYVDSGVDASITVAIADITMLAPDATPYVTNTGTNTDPIFHLFIPRGKGVSSITKTGTSGLVDTYTITYSDGYTTTFTVTNGKGISSITKTGTSGLVDTYTITYNDNTTTTFTVTNGKTAYQSAVEGGYTGTESDFYSDLANFAVYATNAQNSASDAEAYAIGKRGGVDVGNSDPAYHNNAKYYAEQAGGTTFAGLQDVNIDDSTLANGQVPIWNATTEKWKNGTVDVASKMNTDGSNASSAVTFSGKFTVGSRASGSTEGTNSTSLGDNNTASGAYSIAEGTGTTASGFASHAEGRGTHATGEYSHASGYYTSATNDYETVVGKYNEVISGVLFAVGNGTASNAKSNAFSVTDDGFIQTSRALANYAVIAFAKDSDNNYGYIKGGETTVRPFLSGVYSSSVSKLVGDTSVTITDSHITASSIIEPYSSNSNGTPVAYSSIVATTGSVTITFASALTVATDFKVRIIN